MPLTILTPNDVAQMMSCSRRQAFKHMRAAGAIPQGEDLRISLERFERWLNETEFQSPVSPKRKAKADEFPPIKLTRPRPRRRSQGSSK